MKCQMLQFMDLWLNSFTLCYVLHSVTWAVPIHNQQDAQKYFQAYHYTNKAPGDSKVGHITDRLSLFINSILHFQHAWGLKESGTLDNDTLDLMSKDRCGVPDIYNTGDMTRKKRYTLRGGRWYKKEITYKVGSYPTNSGMSASQINEIVDEAVKVWADVTPLTFRRLSSNANTDITIKFATFWHGDEYPFDGIGGTLAHAFFPRYGGDVHFDAHEVWTLRTKYGTNLFQVAAHEFGHSLGLGHSFNRDSLMAPFYIGYTANFRLHPDDIQGIQMIYGAPKGFNPAESPPRAPAPPPPPDIPDNTPSCESIEFDTITSHLESNSVYTYAFFGENYARIDNVGMVSGYPRPISNDWPGLPSDIDASLYWGPQYEDRREWDWDLNRYKTVKVLISPARTYFFKGRMYWRYQNKQLSSGYPREITKWFRGVPDDLDAAFVWSGNGVTYFVKGDKYYRYSRGSGVDWGYPRQLSIWKGLPPKITTALQWEGNSKTYFFYRTRYYRFDDRYFKTGSGYPRDIHKWWLNCRSQGLHEAPIVDRFNDTTERSSMSPPNSSSVIYFTKTLAVMSILVTFVLL